MRPVRSHSFYRYYTQRSLCDNLFVANMFQGFGSNDYGKGKIMTIQLGPGGNTALDSGLDHIQVALSWEKAPESAGRIDIDACAFLVKNDGKVRTDRDFIFFNQKTSACGALCLRSETAERQIFDIDLGKIPEEVAKIEFALAIHPQPGRVLNFSQLRAARIEIANGEATSSGIFPRSMSNSCRSAVWLLKHSAPHADVF